VNRDLLELAELPAADRCGGPAEQFPLVAALLRADLECLAALGDRLDEQLAFVDGQRERLLAVDMLASRQGGECDRRVPMVGCADRHRFDIRPIEQLAIVLDDVGLLEMLGLGSFGVATIDVANGHNIGAVALGPVGVVGPLPAQADGSEDRPIVLCCRSPSGAAEPIRSAGGQRGTGTGLKKSTSIRFANRHVFHSSKPRILAFYGPAGCEADFRKVRPAGRHQDSRKSGNLPPFPRGKTFRIESSQLPQNDGSRTRH
jgi:hypothetical protein